MKQIFNNIMKKYTLSQINKIKDFLISEIDDSNLEEVIDFLNSDDETKLTKFSDYLYDGKEYDGICLDGNQYLISNNKDDIVIIDLIGKIYGLSENTEIHFKLSDFVFLIQNKKNFLNY